MTVDEALAYVDRVSVNWAGPVQAEYALCALASEVRLLRTCGVVEMMCQNVNVDSFVREHEQRTEKAEAALAALRQQRCETCQHRAHDEFDLSRGGPDWCLKHDHKCSALGHRCGAWARREP